MKSLYELNVRELRKNYDYGELLCVVVNDVIPKKIKKNINWEAML